MVLRFQLGALSTEKHHAVNAAVNQMMSAPLGLTRDTTLSDVAQAHGQEAAMRSAARKVATALLDQGITVQQFLNMPAPLHKVALKKAIEEFHAVFFESAPSESNNYGHAMLMLGYMDDALSAYMARNKPGRVAHMA